MTFLEFGCARIPEAVKGDGHSTVFLADLASRTDSEFASCDISRDAILCAKGLIETHGIKARLRFMESDALALAKTWDKPLDFLLLDGCAEWPAEDGKEFADAHLAVFRELERWMKPDSLVMVDDTEVRGKSVIPYMKARGWAEISLCGPREGAVLRRV